MCDRKRTVGSVLLAFALAAPVPALAAGDILPDGPGAKRIVRLFDLFCMTHVPNLETIAEIASANFEELKDKALERYRPAREPEELRAWRFSEYGGEFALVTARQAPGAGASPPDPAFAAATSYDCTLVLPDDIAQSDIRKELTTLMARAPDDTLKAGPVHAARWNGRTPEMLVNVLHYGPANGEPGGGLKTVAFVLPRGSAKSNAALTGP